MITTDDDYQKWNCNENDDDSDLAILATLRMLHTCWWWLHPSVLHIFLCYILCYIVLHFVTLCYFVLHCVTLCYTVLHLLLMVAPWTQHCATPCVTYCAVLCIIVYCVLHCAILCATFCNIVLQHVSHIALSRLHAPLSPPLAQISPVLASPAKLTSAGQWPSRFHQTAFHSRTYDHNLERGVCDIKEHRIKKHMMKHFCQIDGLPNSIEQLSFPDLHRTGWTKRLSTLDLVTSVNFHVMKQAPWRITWSTSKGRSNST